jgi:hypothetical protein
LALLVVAFPDRTELQFAFAASTSVQGVYLFGIHVLLGRERRRALWQRLICGSSDRERLPQTSTLSRSKSTTMSTYAGAAEEKTSPRKSFRIALRESARNVARQARHSFRSTFLRGQVCKQADLTSGSGSPIPPNAYTPRESIDGGYVTIAGAEEYDSVNDIPAAPSESSRRGSTDDILY